MSSRAQRKEQARQARLEAERAADAAAARRRRLIAFGGVIAAAALIIVVAVLVSRSGTDPVPTPAEAVAALEGVPQNGPLLGRGDAPVTVEEYVDPQCPFCARFATDQFGPIVDEYLKPGEVRIRLRLLAFLGPDSVKAAQMAAAAGLQDREWQFIETFFAQQERENSGYVTDDFLREVAAKVPGLDVDRALADRDSPAVKQRLDADSQAAEKAGVQSTPTFVVQRRGASPQQATADDLPSTIDQALRQQP